MIEVLEKKIQSCIREPWIHAYEYEEFGEHCSHINMKYGLQVENLMKDFNLSMPSKKRERDHAED